MELTKREKQILTETRERLTRWGRHAEIPATQHELAALLLKLEDWQTDQRHAAELAADATNQELREQIALANRQLGAAKAREANLRKKLSQQTGDGNDATE